MKKYEEIVVKYPLLFEGISDQEPFALFGFECDIGWYDIINNACHVLYSEYRRNEKQYQYNQECLEHFDKYVANRRSYDKTTSEENMRKELEEFKENYLHKMEVEKRKLPKVVQVKEKFGTLRIYVDNRTDVADAVIDYAEAMSEVTCEKCGDAGKTYHMAWHKTLCKQHAIERYSEEKLTEYENR
jgi:hypothetical protein